MGRVRDAVEATLRAVTIHRSQGQTLDAALLDLRDPTFEHGHGVFCRSGPRRRRGGDPRRLFCFLLVAGALGPLATPP